MADVIRKDVEEETDEKVHKEEDETTTDTFSSGCE